MFVGWKWNATARRPWTPAPHANAFLVIRRPGDRHWRSEIADRKTKMSALSQKRVRFVPPADL